MYQVNEEASVPTLFVFKTSRYLIELARKLDQNCHYLANELGFFDDSHKRCKGFKTLTASIYHHLLCKMVKLVTRRFVILWRLLNECLRKVTGDPLYNFNPEGWMGDELGSNWKGIEVVFTEEALKRVSSYKFHYLQARNIHRSKLLLDDDKATFTTLTNNFLQAQTISRYMDVYELLVKFKNSCPVRKGVLTNFIKHQRRSHVFEPFRKSYSPSTNLAEAVRSGWSNTNANHLSLLDAVESALNEAAMELNR